MAVVSFNPLSGKIPENSLQNGTTVSVVLSVPLAEEAPGFVRLLARLDDHVHLLKGPGLHQAVYRYEKRWLPLLAKHQGTELQAPLDVGWIWFVHTQMPSAYEKDCVGFGGQTLPHSFLLYARKQKALATAKQLWREHYGDESFDPPPVPKSVSYTPSAFSCDLIAAAERLASFCYQVALPHYRDKMFLLRAEKRYKMFLLLKRQHGDAPLVPTCDIDFMWQLHRAYPLEYKLDCESMFGRLWVPDESLVDGRNAERLPAVEAQITRLWRRMFGALELPFAADGAMGRGRSSRRQIARVSPTLLASDDAAFRLEITSIALYKGDFPKKFDSYRLTVHHNMFSQKVDWPENALRVAPKGGFGIESRLGIKSRVAIQIHARKKTLPCGTVSVFDHAIEIESIAAVSPTRHGVHELKLALGEGTLKESFGLSLGVRVTWIPLQEVNFACDIGLMEAIRGAPLLSELYPHLQGATTERVTEGISFDHTLTDPRGQTAFRVRVLHGTAPQLAAVHVMSQDGVIQAVAHLINTEQLPLASSLEVDHWNGTGIPCFLSSSSQYSERVMLVKDCGGDAFVVRGCWMKLEGSTSKYGDMLVPMGVFDVTVFDLRNRSSSSHPLSMGSPLADLRWRDVTIDLDTGAITLRKPDIECLSAQMAVAFSIGALFSLCCPVVSPTENTTRCVTKGPGPLNFLSACGFTHRDKIPSEYFLSGTRSAQSPDQHMAPVGELLLLL